MSDGNAGGATAKRAVVGLGGGFMVSTEAKVAAKEGGYRGWQLYVAGRGGVLGDVTGDEVVAAMGFLEPGLVRGSWESALAVRPVAETVERYTAVCHAWGRNRFEGVDGLDLLGSLLEGVVERADPEGLPLFAGWRAVPLPDDGPARVTQALHVLREHRGGLHLRATREVGLTPVESIVAGSGGVGNARFFGWPRPYPEVDDALRERRDRAEAMTADAVAPAYAGLTDAEVAELATLLGHLGAVAAAAAAAVAADPDTAAAAGSR